MRKRTMMTTITPALPSSASASLAVSPSEVLPDNEDVIVFDNGVKIRKGTIAATFANARMFESLREGAHSEQELEKLRAEQISLIPALEQIGLFAFFGAEDMLGSSNEGRAWIALLYFSLNPGKLTPQAVQKIAALESNSSALLANEIKNLFN